MKRFLLFILPCLLLASCQEEMIETPSAVVPSDFKAMIEETTKTSLDENRNVLWSYDDRVSIFEANGVNAQYRVTDESVGKTSASLDKVSTSGFTAGTELPEFDANVALYPYSSSTSVVKTDMSYVVSIALPVQQSYFAGSFGPGAFPMAAVTASASDKNLAFKNICGALKLQLIGNAKIRRISVTGNNDEVLAGTADVTVQNGALPQIEMTGTEKTVTLDCGEAGVQLDGETATAFVIVLPVVTFTGGFTVVATDTDGKSMEIKTVKEKAITRSNILKMTTVEYEGKAPVAAVETVDLGLPSGLLWTTCNVGASSPEEAGNYYAWGEAQPKDAYGMSSYLYWSGSGSTYSYPFDNPAGAEYDAATATFGDGYRMPTKDEFDELINFCEWTTETFNGHKGYRVSSLINENSIFIPFAGNHHQEQLNSSDKLYYYDEIGEYWCSTKASGVSGCGYILYSSQSSKSTTDGMTPYYGFTIRAVSKPAGQADNTIHAVDLGLGVKWSSMGLGADSFGQIGDLYAWGEKATKQTYDWSTYLMVDPGKPYSYPSNPYMIKYNNTDGLTELEPEDDVAASLLGEGWRLPSQEMVEELYANTTKKKINYYGVEGDLRFSTIKGYEKRYIFIPYREKYYSYWTSTICTKYSTDDGQYAFIFNTGGYSSEYTRCGGMQIRPVYLDESSIVHVSGITLEPASLYLNVGDSGTINVSVTPENATNKAIKWTSSNSSVATVDKGVVKGVSIGSATITAKSSDGGFEKTCEVTVAPVAPAGTVDLGLSVYWAECNLGANSPEGTGKYYAWGETTTRDCYNWESYKWGLAEDESLEKYNNNPGYGTVDNKTTLDMQDDVAYVTNKDKWRMPTSDEIDELLANCDSEWTTLNGVNGTRFTSRITGRSIFLPAAGYRSNYNYESVGKEGYYFSSSLYSSFPDYAYKLYITSSKASKVSSGRLYGCSIRPVYGDRVVVTGVTIENGTSMEVAVGEVKQMKAVLTPANSAEKGVIWSSSDPSVATVNYLGNVIGVKKGTTVITAKTVDGGYTAKCNVTVIAGAPEMVDLGLSVKWAPYNIGASNSLEYGDYYAWGEIETYYQGAYSYYYPKWKTGKDDGYSFSSYSFYSNSQILKYNTSSDHGTVDNKVTLDLIDDVANQEWGSGCRIPTIKEWQELIDNCTWYWTEYEEPYINGFIVESNKPGYTGKSIFLPCAGYLKNKVGNNDRDRIGSYWSSSLCADDPETAYEIKMYVDSNSHLDKMEKVAGYRYEGKSIRPVKSK